MINNWNQQGWLIFLEVTSLTFLSQYMVAVQNHHLHCSTSGQSSSLFYLSDKISELCRTAWIFYNNILDILVTAQGRRPSHHLHCSTSGQISSLFYLSDKFADLELCRIAWMFFSSSLTPQLEAQVLDTPVCSAHCVAGWGCCCWWADSWPWRRRVGWSWPAIAWAESPSKSPAPAPRRPGTDKGAVENKPASAFVWFGSMRGLVPELHASKSARPGRRAIESGTRVRTQPDSVCTLYVPSRNEENWYKKWQNSTYSVRTGTYWYRLGKYVLLSWFLYSVRTEYVRIREVRTWGK